MTIDTAEPGLGRHFLGVDRAIPLDADGFLADPSDDAWWLSSDARPRPVSELVDQPGSFVLLASGGVGKTTVLERLRDRERHAVSVDLRLLDRGDMRRALEHAIGTGRAVYVDAVDEAILYEPAVARILQEVLSGPLARPVWWRLACRPTAWNPGLGQALAAALPGFEELRLLPLTRTAAGDLAREAGVEPSAFVDAICRARLGRLAAAPLRLRAAARQWAAEGTLPSTHVEAIEFEVRQLLAEGDSVRPLGIVPADRRYRLAGRLGALVVFCGVSRFAIAAAAASGVASVVDLPSAPEPDEPGTPALPEHFGEVLSTALFDAAPGAAVSFRHQQYAEYLTARYLIARGIRQQQLPGLLGLHANGLLPGAMVGVAAWLAALNPDLTRELVDNNALGFANGGVELPSDEVRAAVVEGLLTKAAAGDIDPVWGLDLSGLAHAGLGARLLEQVSSGLNRAEQLWWVARLAEAGGHSEVTPSLVDIVLASGWPDWARSAAIGAVATLGDDTELVRLRPLLYLGAVEDPDDEILAETIDALYPRLLSTLDLAGALRARRNRDLVGGYLVLLGDLSTRVPSGDLPIMLNWAAAHVRDGEDAYGRLISRLVITAWEDPDWQAVQGPLAALVAALAKDRDWHTWARRDAPHWLEDDSGRRRQLAVATADRLEGTHGYQLLDLQLVVPEDVDWLLDELPTMAPGAQEILANCLPHLLHQPSARVADRILTLPHDHPGSASTDSLRQSLRLDSEPAKRWRRHREIETARAEGTDSREERDSHLSQVIEGAQQDTSAWWLIVYWLSVDDTGHADEALFAHDLTGRPAWTPLDDRQRGLVLDIGARYLGSHELEPANWQGHQTISVRSALPDWAGVYLLTTWTRHDPNRVRSLAPQIWRRWAAAIVGAWNYEEGDDAGLRSKLVDLAPPDGRDYILSAAIDHLDALEQHSRHVTPHRLYEHLWPELAPTIAERMTAGRYSGQLANEVLALLIEHAPQTALETCHQLQERSDRDLAVQARRGQAQLDPDAIIEELAAQSPTADDLAEVVPSLNIPTIDQEHLAMLGRVLLDHFPIHDDPRRISDFYTGTPESRTRQARNTVLQRLAELGQTSTINELAEGRAEPDGEALRRLARQARAREADLAFSRPTPQALLALLATGDARLVRHSGDLLTVIAEQLREIQHAITHQGAFRDVWNLDPQGVPRPKPEDDISDWVRRQLEQRLRHGTIVDREVQVTRQRQGGIGTRIDLTATTPTATHPGDTARVIAEAKLVNNSELMTAMGTQLVQRYLQPAGLQHGIYLVFWIAPQQRPLDWRGAGPTDPDEFLQQLEQQAAEMRDDAYVMPFLLDISRPMAQAEEGDR